MIGLPARISWLLATVSESPTQYQYKLVEKTGFHAYSICVNCALRRINYYLYTNKLMIVAADLRVLGVSIQFFVIGYYQQYLFWHWISNPQEEKTIFQAALVNLCTQ